jgi:hypothetical protein
MPVMMVDGASCGALDIAIHSYGRGHERVRTLVVETVSPAGAS